MTPNKQVSPAIRILRGERDASARATHLEAVTRKYLVTTIERKQMSTKTNFKRIALVAVAALGLGVLSSVPSNAATPPATLTLSTTAGTMTAAKSDSSTAAKVVVNFFKTAATDSVVVSVGLKSKPTAATTLGALNIMALDTAAASVAQSLVVGDTTTASRLILDNAGSTNAYLGATYAVYIESSTASSVRAAGTYVLTFVATPYEGATPITANIKTIDVTITQAALASEDKVANSGQSTEILSAANATTGAWQATVTDSVVAGAAKVSTIPVGVIKIDLKNANGNSSVVADSITASIDKGNIAVVVNSETVPTVGTGKSLAAVNYPAGSAYAYVYIFGDGTSGTATATIKTLSAGTVTKSLTFVGADVKSIVASSYRSVIGVGTTSTAAEAIKANAYDVNSTSFGSSTTLYAYSSDTTVISNYGTLCANWVAADGAVYCALSGLKAGTANITLRDAATVAASTVASNAVAVRVSIGTLSSFTLTTDKASYAPGEKGYLIVTAKDAAGLVMPYVAASTYASTTFFNKDGVTYTTSIGNGSDDINALTKANPLAKAFDRSSTPSSTDPIAVYTFFAPAAAGSLTFSAKGGTLMSSASQATATTATITVADSASAALAAVSALAVTVASLKTLITTLTNLVLKIQKKVKA
jgi:hypothetical protein